MSTINDFKENKKIQPMNLKLPMVTGPEVKESKAKRGRKENPKVNQVRTKLLLFADEDRNKYVKNCKILINNMPPKEIIKKYSQSITVSFNNPIMRSETAGIEQLSHRGAEVPQRGVDSHREIGSVHGQGYYSHRVNTIIGTHYEKENKELKENTMNSSIGNGFKLNKAVGVFYFSKCIKEIGKDFIDQRKRNVSYKKLERDTVGSSKRPSHIQIETEFSFIETINNLNSTKNKSSNKSTSKRKSEKVFTFPKSLEELFIDKEEREARNIQNNYNKLQDLVKMLKVPDSEESLDNLGHQNGNHNKNFYKDFKNNFNEELFDILEYKGLKFDPKIISSSSVANNNLFSNIIKGKNHTADNFKFHSYNQTENFFVDRLVKLESEKEYEENYLEKDRNRLNFPIRSIIHPKKNSEMMPKNPFAQNIPKSDEKAKRPKNMSLYDLGLETNETTRNVSINKNKFTNNCAYYEDEADCTGQEEDENYQDEYDETILDMQETPIGKRCTLTLTYTYSSNKDMIDFLSDNELENRVSTISNGAISISDKVEVVKAFGTSNSDNQILKLIKCNNGNNFCTANSLKYDSEMNSGSDISRGSNNSNLSKNKSEYTQMSNISEMSDEFTEKIL